MATTINGDTGVIFPDASTQSKAVSQVTPFAVTASAIAGAELQLPEATANGVNYVAVKAPNTLAANTTFTLPSADGTNGQYLQTNGSGALAFATVPTTNPAGTTGQIQINNAGAFGAVDSGAASQGLISQGAGLAPTWGVPGLSGFAKLSSVAFTPTMNISAYGVGQSYTIDADRVLYITVDTTGGLIGFVFNKTTNTMGTTVTLRSGSNLNNIGFFKAIVISSSSVLLVSLPGASTALQGVILSISGTTITVNTAGSVTSAANNDNTGIGLIAVGSSYVVCGSDATTSGLHWAVAFTVSGTTVTFPGSVTTIAGGATAVVRPQPFDIGSSRVAFLINSTVVGVYTFTVSGTTLTSIANANAGASTATSNGSLVGTLLSSGRLGIVWLNGATNTPYGAICSFSGGGTPSFSSVQLTSNTSLSLLGCSVVGSQIVCYINGNTNTHAINVLTDNAGTAVAGTAYSYTATGNGQRVKITNTGMWLITSTTTVPVIFNVTISGNNPVVTPIAATTAGNTGMSLPVVGANDTYLGIAGSNPQAPYGSSYFIASSGRAITNANSSTRSPIAVSFDGTSIKSYVGEMFSSGAIRESDNTVGIISASSDAGTANTKFIFERWQFVG
jgi:hypothetical protein